MEQSSSWEPGGCSSGEEIAPYFTEPKSLVLCSQYLTSGPYPEPYFRRTSCLPMNVGHIRPCWSHTCIISTIQCYRKTLCAYVDFALLGHTTCVGSCLPTFWHGPRFMCYMTHIYHPLILIAAAAIIIIIIIIITIIIICDYYKLWSSTLCSCLQPTVTLFMLGPRHFSQHFFSQTSISMYIHLVVKSWKIDHITVHLQMIFEKW